MFYTNQPVFYTHQHEFYTHQHVLSALWFNEVESAV
jgi:hypothetical protein